MRRSRRRILWGAVHTPFLLDGPGLSSLLAGAVFKLERELIEKRYTELRQEGRRLSGVAIRYGEIGQGPLGHPERFEPFAFGDLSGADISFSLQHQRTVLLARSGGGGLELEDSRESLEIRATLPETQDANDALTLVKNRVLRGLSIEFSAIRERVQGGVRVIEKALLIAVSLVDTPAYPGSLVEARRRGGRGGGGRRRRRSFSRSRIPYRKTLGCDCHRGTCNKVRFNKGAFDEAINSDDDVLAIAGGDFSRAMASKNRGSLVLKSSDDGLDVELGRAAGLTPAGRELAATEKSVSIFARPIFDQDSSDFTEAELGGETVATYSRVKLRAILFKPIAEPGDWPEVDFFTEGRETVQVETELRRVWL